MLLVYFPGKSQFGFTLLEVLVALAVLAVAGSGLLYASNENLKNAAYLENKTLATWVAQNKITDLRLQDHERERIRSGTETVAFAGRRWEVEIEVENSDVESLHKVSVSASLENRLFSGEVLSELVVYMGEH